MKPKQRIGKASWERGLGLTFNATTEDINCMQMTESQKGIEYTEEEWERCELDERKLVPIAIEKEDIIRFHLSGVRKDLIQTKDPLSEDGDN